MPLLDKPINQQNFELAGVLIASILADELPNQSILTGEELLNATVNHERSIPVAFNQMPLVNITFNNGSYDNNHASQADGEYTYNVDVYTSGKSNSDKNGDEISSLDNQRILGVCRAILMNPKYDTLLLPRPSISRVECNQINVSEPNNRHDTEHTFMGRLSVLVRVPESVQLIDLLPDVKYLTSIKLDEGGSGYIFTQSA